MCFRSLPLNYMSRLLSVALKIQQHNVVRVFIIIANNVLISFFCEMIMLHNLVTGKDGSESSQCLFLKIIIIIIIVQEDHYFGKTRNWPFFVWF